jgi:hypothetical protein
VKELDKAWTAHLDEFRALALDAINTGKVPSKGSKAN